MLEGSGTTPSPATPGYGSSDTLLPIVIVKEYYWCPVQAYLKLVTWMERPTPSMEEGGATGWNRGQLLEALARVERLDEAVLHWELPVMSRRLGIAGRADLVLEYEGEVAVVEVKARATPTMLRRRGVHILAQLAAYAIAAEETIGKPALRAYIYGSEGSRLIRVAITPHHRALVENAVRELRRMLETHNVYAQPRPPRRRCTVCSYRGVCPLR